MMRSDLRANDWPQRQKWLRHHASGAEISSYAAERLRRTGYIDRFWRYHASRQRSASLDEMGSREAAGQSSESSRMKRMAAWAVRMESNNQLDGHRVYLLGTPKHPCRTELFHTRKDARAFIQEHFGYQRNRPDLRKEPHGWRMPVAVRVDIQVSERASQKQGAA